jgi:hypothetical protein
MMRGERAGDPLQAFISIPSPVIVAVTSNPSGAMHGPGLFSLARLTTLFFSVLVSLSSGSNYVCPPLLTLVSRSQ